MKLITTFFFSLLAKFHWHTIQCFLPVANIFPYELVAMDEEDGETEVSVSSLILNSIDSQQKEVISPEDLAWVDSCLIEDTDVLESSWNPLKNALLEIISSTPESFKTDGGADLPSSEENKNVRFRGTGNDFSPVSVASERSTDGMPDGKMTYTLPSSTFQENHLPVSDGNMQESNHNDLELNLDSSTYDMDQSYESSSTYNVLPASIAAAGTVDISNNEKTETLPSLTFQGNPFLPTYGEHLKENEIIDSGLNLDSSAYDMEQSSDDIFKIWDLNIPFEEGELVKQLNKALAANSFQTMPPPFEDSEELKVSEEGSLDNLIAGIADLSLNQDAG